MRIVSTFSGVGMLDVGLHGALRRLGFEPRTVLYVEREPYAQEILTARMRDGLLDAAPIWPDVTTLDGALLRGGVDCVVGGFPCQDLSLAGARAGLGDGTRSGLFFALLKLAVDCGAPLICLENVAGIVSAPTPVPWTPEEDQWQNEEAVERAAAVVTGALADAGYDAAWLPLSASDAGAPHGRARWFCLAYRVADAQLR